MLGRSATAAVCVSRLAGFPTGFELDLVTMTESDSDVDDPLLFGAPTRRRAAALADALRFGVQFSTGARATNGWGPPNRLDQPDGPVLVGGQGGGGGGSWRQTFWVWPLPPAGPLTFACRWPAAGIPLTRTDLDAQVIIDAARRALVIFPDAAGMGGGGAAFSTVSASAAPPGPQSGAPA